MDLTLFPMQFFHYAATGRSGFHTSYEKPTSECPIPIPSLSLKGQVLASKNVKHLSILVKETNCLLIKLSQPLIKNNTVIKS